MKLPMLKTNKQKKVNKKKDAFLRTYSCLSVLQALEFALHDLLASY